MNYEDMTTQAVFDAVGITIESKPEFRSDMERKLIETWGGGQKRWKEGICKICAATIQNPRMVARVLDQEVVFVFGCCERCTPIRDSHYDRSNLSAAQHVSLTPQWDEKCPALYKDFIVGKLPDTVERDLFKRVTDWRPEQNGSGLILVGDSGKGKTTCLWGLYRELERTGTNPVFLTAVELQRQLSEAARDIKDVKHLTHCKVLIIDDLGKEKLTSSVAALLWEVVDARYANRRPMVISTRYSGDKFEERFGDAVLGGDIRRRIIDSCRVVPFKAVQT